MNKLVKALASVVRTKIQEAISGPAEARLESRFIFNGPPLPILEELFQELSADGGINAERPAGSPAVVLPVLLQLPRGAVGGANPLIGVSGKCDENHLLHIRNDPNSASFVALLPPGQYSNKSVASTTEEFGINPANNTGHATFEDWWQDEFVQQIARRGLAEIRIGDDRIEDALLLVGAAAAALDEIDVAKGSRNGAWNLLSRLYSISENSHGLSTGSALALACGLPPTNDGTVVPKIQLGVLQEIAAEMADGFKSGIDRLAANTNREDLRSALAALLAHLRLNCEIPTAFERATAAYYLPLGGSELQPPPPWWTLLTSEKWAELLADEPEEVSGDLAITCTNSIIPSVGGMPAIVNGGAEFAITTSSATAGNPVEVVVTGGSTGKTGKVIQVKGSEPFEDDPSTEKHRSPFIYKVSAQGKKTASAKVISLATWQPGIVVTSRLASKLSPPRKPRRSMTGLNWETSLSLPGSGRYELLLFTAPGTTIIKAEGVADDATEQLNDVAQQLAIQPLKGGGYQIEVEIDGKFQLDITYRADGERGHQACRAYIACEEAKEEGCKSEFERLIMLNRRHLDKLDSKAIIQLDRHARLSGLQSWLLDEQNVRKSFIPVVLSDDYASKWTSPDWDGEAGPILSGAQFLHDPRPPTSLFQAPREFIQARAAIAARVRETSDFAGLMESAPLGKWLSRDDDFKALVEQYLDSYMAWLGADRDVACWVDTIAVCPREAGGHTLGRVPDAIILSPLHPLRLAWHCLAQQAMFSDIDGHNRHPCPAASILDPDCVPDLLALSLQAPGGPTGIERVNFLSVECNSDYWSVLWNGTRLDQIASKARQAPFDHDFGLVIGGISSGFSPAQVARSLEDISELLSAKSVISLVVSSAGGATDACNEGLATWCANHFGDGENTSKSEGVGPRFLEVYDTRPEDSQPDQATISNLSEDTGNRVRWYNKQPPGVYPDLGIVAQLDSTQAESKVVETRTPLGIGGLIRHRVRRQLHGAFLSESRQSMLMPPSGETFCDKLASCIVSLEDVQDSLVGLQFAPNVHAVSNMLYQQNAGFVAVSSSAIDPACFLGGWIKGTYLWDYDLPSYSHRAGDTSGYYLLSQVRDADRDALRRVLQEIPGVEKLAEPQLEEILLEVARRGIPTVRGLSGDDTGATGDLGLFLAVRLLQDQFRVSGNVDSLLPVMAGTDQESILSIIVPVDPFRGYLADLTRSLGKERRDMSLSRPDLLVICIKANDDQVRIHMTPVEVKCRSAGTVFGPSEAKDALSQAKSLAKLLAEVQVLAAESLLWKLAYQHLLLSIIGFGLRVYSQHERIVTQGARWATYHQRIAAAILAPEPQVSIDPVGRLIVIDGSQRSDAYDHDNDGFAESIYISQSDAGRIVAGDAENFYASVRAKVGDWRLFPGAPSQSSGPAELTEKHDQAQGSDVDISGSPPSTPATIPAPSDAPPVPAATDAQIASESLGSQVSTGILLEVGRASDGFEPRNLSLNISDTRLNQLNIGVVGDLGTGKTQLLKSLIYQISAAKDANRGIKPRFLIFDYKRDYSNPEFVAATGARVVRPTRIPLNLFDTTSMGESVAPWLDRFRFFSDVLDKIYSGIGPVQRDKLKGAVRTAYENCAEQGRQPTIYDIHAEYRELLAGKTDTPMAIIDDLVDMEIFERDQTKTMSFDAFLDGVVVISLDAMGQDDRTKNMLVAVMLNMFYENMLRTPKRPFIGTTPQLRVIDSYLLVDEADNIMRYEFDVLRKLLLQGREFGSGVILASQYLRHYKTSGTDYREPLLTWFIHKVPNVTAAELGALGFSSDLGEISERVKGLHNHHCLYKSFDVPGEVIRGLPFYELQQAIESGTKQ